VSNDRSSGGGGFGALLLVLIVVGAVVKYAVWVAAIIGAIVLIATLLIARSYRKQRALERAAGNAEIAARCDEQHAAILAGDDRGIYGEWTPVPHTPNRKIFD
jgi:ABC-type Fe3+-siderophore transport system permease subunit